MVVGKWMLQSSWLAFEDGPGLRGLLVGGQIDRGWTLCRVVSDRPDHVLFGSHRVDETHDQRPQESSSVMKKCDVARSIAGYSRKRMCSAFGLPISECTTEVTRSRVPSSGSACGTHR